MRTKKNINNLILDAMLFAMMFFLNGCASNVGASVKTELCGLIIDENNQPAQNVLVGCKMEKGAWYYVMTNENGFFVFKNAKFGKYKFVAEKEGYLRLEENEIIFSDRKKLICFQMERLDSVFDRIEKAVICRDFELAKNLLSNLVLKQQHHLNMAEEYGKIIDKMEENANYEQSDL